MVQHSVFERRHVTEAEGKKVSAKWLDDFKGENVVCNRFVAQQVADTARDDTFAGTPPVKFVRLALAMGSDADKRPAEEESPAQPLGHQQCVLPRNPG